MVWFLALHIIALVFWCAALLYLPLVLATGNSADVAATTTTQQYTLERFVFTHIATPAALVAIIAGTAVFLVDRNTAPWLILKLALVAALVVGHTVTGFLIPRLEDTAERPGALRFWLLGVMLAGLMAAIVWTVLAKPELTVTLEREDLPWID